MRDLYPYMQMAAFFLMMFTALQRPRMLAFDRRLVLYVFLLTFVVGTAFKFLLFGWLFRLPEFVVGGMRDKLSGLPLNFLLGVWWEDCFFVLPAIYVWRWATRENLSERQALRRGYVTSLFSVLMCCLFVSGHAYQGLWGLTTAIYWQFSFKFGRRYGLGSPILCHLCIDLSNLLFLKWYLAYRGVA